MTGNDSGNKAFTLIEVLLVFAIVSLLSSIILASTKSSKDRAKIAKALEFSQTVYHRLGAEAVGVWDFDENALNTCGGGADACDSSSYNNHGTFNGDTNFIDDTPYHLVGQGSGRRALTFDGTGDYVNCGNNELFNIDPGEAGTLEAWFRGGAQMPGSFGTILWKEGGCIGWHIHLYDNGDVVLGFNTGTGSCTGMIYYAITVNDSDYNDNRWHNVVGVIDRPNLVMELFIDGVKKGRISIDNTKLGAGGTARIGTNWDNSRPFSGLIDDVRVYKQAFTSAQIQKHYTEGLEKHQLVDLTFSLNLI